MFRSRRLLLFVLGVIPFFVAGAGILLAREARKPLSLTIAYSQLPYVALLFVAQEQGYFADENLKVTLLPRDSGREAVKAMLRREADLSASYTTPLSLQALAGHDLRIFGSLHYSLQGTGIVARRDRGILTAADLTGARVGLPLGTNAEFFVEYYMTSMGIASGPAQLVDLEPSELVPALAEGRVDAVCGWEPYLSEARKALGRARQVSFLSDIYMEVSALAGREGLENPHGRHLERLMRALVRAEQFVNEHEMRALEIVDRYLTNRDRRTVRDYWQVSEFKVRLDNVFLAVFSQEYAWLSGRGGQMTAAKHRVKEYLVPRFLQGADPLAVTVF